jgi:mono/diheme cytochrome c family protein
VAARCAGPAEEEAGKERGQAFRRAASHGRLIYQQRCVQCHQADGQGQGKVYPPLAQADYLLEDMGRAACVVRYGLKGKILVNGKDYNLAMIGYPELRKQEIAHVLTYIANAWGNDYGLVTRAMVDSALQQCSQPMPKQAR